MATPLPGTVSPASAPGDRRKPRDEELDIHGLTHRGKVRPRNEDHFLIASLHRQVRIEATSLSDTSAFAAPAERLAFLAMVADGVGGGNQGQEAARRAVERVTRYVAESAHCFYATDERDDRGFAEALQEAALRTHAAILEEGAADPALRGMATTLTLWLGVWPRSYLLQVGDSRCYVLRGDTLTQVSRDQTMAEELIERGVFSPGDAAASRWAHVLSSAIGGRDAPPMPVVTRIDQDWGTVGLLCSDGLTKHVPDERIRERLRTMTSARQACEALLQDALDAGGTDNVTIVIGRAVRRADAA